MVGHSLGRLFHYSSQPFVLEPRRYQQPHRESSRNPHGLWLSIEGPYDWPTFLRDAATYGPPLGRSALAHRTLVTLRSTADLIVLSSESQIDDFDREYGVITEEFSGIDWAAVADRYDGVAFAPYLQSELMRSARHWYPYIDCASACIWDLRALAVSYERSPSGVGRSRA